MQLAVVGHDGFASCPLPATGTLIIGRGEEADIRLDDARVSRRHAAVHLGPVPTIEDLGSANGTWVRGQRLGQGERTDLALGDGVQIGDHGLLVQRAGSPSGLRRLLTHEAFVQRVEQECRRWEERGPAFALLRVRLHTQRTRGCALQALVSTLRPFDPIATYGPGDYEALMTATSRDEAITIGAQLGVRLDERGSGGQVAVASCPEDGRTVEALVARLSALLLHPGRPASPEACVAVRSRRMQELHRTIDRAAAGNINVLVLGETGVGKDVLVKYLHGRSPRAALPLVRVNCAALSETLLESELFGHERGAFTGATQTKPGILETACGGTVFLDEVGELPLTVQAKLLHAIESKEVLRVGSLRSRTIDARFVAATNRDLEAEIARGQFRQDLYFRLNGFTVTVPPLRERVEEILPLARLFASEACRQLDRAEVPVFAPEVEALLLRYRWPGNVRELRNVVERAVLLCEAGVVGPGDLPEKMSGIVAASPGITTAGVSVGDDERQRILGVLAACGSNQTQAARVLGISRGTLAARLRAYGVPRSRARTLTEP